MESAPQLCWARRPQQARSKQTLERILVAAESLIALQGFEGATIADIVVRAESSVGAFYTRFKDKDALLRCLVERFADEATATVNSALQPLLWADKPTEQVIQRLIHFMMRMVSQRVMLIRAIAQITIREPQLGRFREKLLKHATEGLIRLLASRAISASPASPASPEVAISVIAWLCHGIFESSVLGPALPHKLSQEQTETELSTMIVAYLKTKGIA